MSNVLNLNQNYIYEIYSGIESKVDSIQLNIIKPKDWSSNWISSNSKFNHPRKQTKDHQV